MKISFINTIISLILLLFICAAIIYLQVYLCKKESKYLGLILPVISLIFALMNVVGVATFTIFDSISKVESYTGLFVAFLVANIPTIILVFIYLGIREKKNMKKELDKMNIKDL